MPSDQISPVPMAFVEGEPRVDSRYMAGELGINHKNARELIEQYLSDFEEFGVSRFETAKPSQGSLGGRPEKFYWLNEDQSYLLLTYVRNTDQARVLKKRLVHSFGDCRRALSGPAVSERTFQQQTEARLDRLEQIVDSLMASFNPALPRPAPVIPDWQRILKTVLREIETGKYPFPHAFREIDGVPCVILRTAQVMAHLRTMPRLRSFFDGLMSKSDRVLKRQLRDAGLILRARTNPTVAGQSLHHAVAIKLEGVRQQRLMLNG